MDQAVRAFESSLQLEPFNIFTRKILVESYSPLGQKAKAQTEFDLLLQMTPVARHQDLRRWLMPALARICMETTKHTKNTKGNGRPRAVLAQ